MDACIYWLTNEFRVLLANDVADTMSFGKLFNDMFAFFIIYKSAQQLKIREDFHISGFRKSRSNINILLFLTGYRISWCEIAIPVDTGGLWVNKRYKKMVTLNVDNISMMI